MSSNKLPADFVWGFATAAYQIEGSTNVDGRLDSIWDEFCRIPGKIADGTSGDHTTESYKLWREDIKLLKEYGAKSYRFSLSWSRIIPKGGRNDPVNELGLKFYSDLIDELLANGIQPLLTIHHWDFPATLHHRYGGWLNLEESTLDFERYARVVFEALGDRVKFWLTFNEPVVITTLGYGLGVFAPGRSSDRSRCKEGDSSTEPWTVGHSILIAHGLAVKAYREEFKSRSPDGAGIIGITLNGDWCEPYDDSEDNKAAAQRAQEFWISWYADPVYLTGDYPACMREQLGDRLPKFTPEQSKLVLGSSDFYGMNTYTTNLVKDRKEKPELDDFKGNVEFTFTRQDGSQLGTQAQSPWLQDVPWGFRKLLNWIYKRYQYPIYVTENGFSVKNENDRSAEDIIHDTERVNYYKGYLDALAQAKNEDKVDVRGYLAWSLLDNFEWASGLTERFGTTYVDYKTQTRTPKDSARYIFKFFRENVGA